jgi:alanine dehydrogenase
MTSSTLLLTRDDVRKALPLDDCVEAVSRAFARQAAREDPPSALLGVHVPGGVFHAKAAVLEGFFAIKLNANFPGNPARSGRPTIQGLVALLDATDGHLLAVMDSIEITILRTAAATALAARYLARADSKTATICGCGAQADTQLDAIVKTSPISRVFAYDQEGARAARFARERSAALGIEVHPVTDLSAAVRQSDICVTCTTARGPLIGPADVRPGTFIAAVGADSPEKQELDTRLLAIARVVVDNLEQCATIGELHHALEHGLVTTASVHAELGELIAGIKTGRTSDDEITIFDSTGTAIQDVAAAAVVYERSRLRGELPRLDLAS